MQMVLMPDLTAFSPREFGRRERIADRVRLPRIRLVGRDRLVDLIHPPRLGRRDHCVGKQAPGSGEIVDHFARLDDLVVGEEPPRRIVERRAAQQRQLGIAVVVDLFDIVEELVPGQTRRLFLLDLRIPVLGGEVVQAEQFLVVEVVTDEVGLHVEDELPGEALCSRLHQLRRMRFGRVDLEHVGPIDLLHGEEGGGHAAACRQELAAAEAEFLSVLIGKLENPPFDALLSVALCWRKILAVGDDLRWYWR
jgi:hypothetical protein